METTNRFIDYLIMHGYPESSIAVEYEIGKNTRVDIAILDTKTNLPIQLFELKSRKNQQMIEMGKRQISKYKQLLGNKNIPTYLVFPESIKPYFSILDISDTENENTMSSLNYKGQKNSRIAEEVREIKHKKERTIDNFKIICWILAVIVLFIALLNKYCSFNISAIDLTLLGLIIGLVLIPFASKLKILGVEFERLTETEIKG